MNSLETILFPETPIGEGIFRLFYLDGKIGKVTSKLSLDEKAVQFLVKDLFLRLPEVNCVEVSSPNLGYTALFPRR